ncbi:MAG: c-type cytochrome [Pseudomonas sp.]
MFKILITTAVLTIGLPGLTQAAGDAAAGEGKIAVCATCHGQDGVAIMPMYPNLHGQNAPYLEAALKAYREGQRTGGTAALMAPMAANLTDEDIADIAAYFSQLK